MTPLSPRISRFSLGRWECYAIQESAPAVRQGIFAESLVYGAPSHGSARFEALTVAAATSRTCVLLCSEEPCQRILIEAGAGQQLYQGCPLLDALGALAIDPAEIDAVLLSHPHQGHAGGALTAAGQLVFPRARHVLSRQEWEFWQAEPNPPGDGGSPIARDRRPLLAALGPRLELVGPNQEIMPGMQALAAPGHTAGHLAYSITSEGHQLLCLGDAVLHPLHLSHPQWSARGDLRPEQAMVSRIRLLDHAVATAALVHAYHFSFPGLGYVAEEGACWRWVPVPAPEHLPMSPRPSRAGE
jgi:glyoxylase-like metal-dependent hydrolase (beta-lactamase superfamily II)